MPGTFTMFRWEGEKRYVCIREEEIEAFVAERLEAAGLRAVPISPQPDSACVDAGHVIASASTAGEWIDMRTLGTTGCPRCAKFWGDTRDAS